ncbi:hypothetical protein GCM10010359_51760 [Streptomyces morookaense]|nr:hypothetical protein GCM10010359_51760 [Streptomyces morookaense]
MVQKTLFTVSMSGNFAPAGGLVTLPDGDSCKRVAGFRALACVPHGGTPLHTRAASANVLCTMRFGLLLLSCRGEGL